MRNKTNRSLIVNDVSKLKDYGFVKEGERYLFYTGNESKFGKVWTITISKLTRKRKKGYQFYCSSHSATTLEVICKLYKDGIIAFEEYRNTDKIIERKQQKIAKLQKEIEALKNEKLY